MCSFQENGHDEITIKAMGRAISKTVMVAELIKVNSTVVTYYALGCLLLKWLLVLLFDT
jgi:hypothetical protein